MTDAADDDLRIAVLRLSRRMRLERESTDVTDTQLSVLFALWRLGPQTLRALAEHDRVSPPSMNRTVGALVEAGLVTREQSAEDGRKVTVAATDAGVELVTAFKERRDAWFSRQLTALDASDRAALDAAAPILRKIADS